jgi:hypothetical protein
MIAYSRIHATTSSFEDEGLPSWISGKENRRICREVSKIDARGHVSVYTAETLPLESIGILEVGIRHRRKVVMGDIRFGIADEAVEHVVGPCRPSLQQCQSRRCDVLLN